MPKGPGVYDDECTKAREATDAEACILIVVNGDRGNGFSVQSQSMEVLLALPLLLREMADEIAKSNVQKHERKSPPENPEGRNDRVD